MSFSIGIVGLPNVGKSTLFSALTRKQVAAENYPFCTIDPNVGVVPVPDARLEALAQMSHSKRVLPTTVEFVDIAGLVAGAHKGEGLGNQFLSHIRQVDAVCNVLRYFHDPNVIHVASRVDPLADLETVQLELVMADLQTVQKRKASLEKKFKAGEKEAVALHGVLEKLLAAFNAGKSASSVGLSEEEKQLIQDLHLLTLKPALHVVNVDEGFDAAKLPDELQKLQPILISSKIEAELVSLSPEEANEYLTSAGITMSGLDQLIVASYRLLHLITFLTTGEKETRAWTIQEGSRAQTAAGVIHTDFIRGFICAEIIPWKDLLDAGSWVNAKQIGKIRTEGKEYTMQDGDVVEFRVGV